MKGIFSIHAFYFFLLQEEYELSFVQPILQSDRIASNFSWITNKMLMMLIENSEIV